MNGKLTLTAIDDAFDGQRMGTETCSLIAYFETFVKGFELLLI